MNIDEKFIRERIPEIRMKRGISEYKMSYELGHNKSYIQSIVSGRSLPSMSEFLYICEYLEITPMEFFDEELDNPALLEITIEKARDLGDADLQLLCQLMDRMKQKK